MPLPLISSFKSAGTDVPYIYFALTSLIVVSLVLIFINIRRFHLDFTMEKKNALQRKWV